MKMTIFSILVAGLLIGGAILLSNSKSGTPRRNFASLDTAMPPGQAVLEGDKQIVEITAKGGYAPRVTSAKAGIPTVIRVATKGTFDCSSALVIPKISYRTNLSPSGVTEIEIPPQAAGEVVTGLCSMGMYNFSIKYE